MARSVKEIRYGLAWVSLLMVGFLAGGCGDKRQEDSPVPGSVDADTSTTMGDSDSGTALGLQTVHYAYDSFALDGESRNVLRTNANILKDKPSLKVQIEGHCDNRGGIQYNLALGEKRANAARNFLMDQGVSGGRVTVISFGKERPLAEGNTEEAWAKNRRANFVITSK